MIKKCIAGALAAALAASAASAATQVCWLETSHGDMDGAMGGAGLRDTKVWHSTVSAILIRSARGDVLVDTGFSPTAEAQMDELPPAGRAFGLNIVGGAKGRTPLVDALATVHETPAQVARIMITHTHYDHLGGATQLAAPIDVAPAEAVWMREQHAHPTITPPSLVAAVTPRLHTLPYDGGRYLGFDKSSDLYGDGTIVAVPLPGHTPGSQGVFVKLGGRQVFLIGDAADTVEAAERGLPKSAPIRSNTDFTPALADQQTRRLADFHRAHPEIALIPAHDRAAYTAAFGAPSTCVSEFNAAAPMRADAK